MRWVFASRRLLGTWLLGLSLGLGSFGLSPHQAAAQTGRGEAALRLEAQRPGQTDVYVLSF